jgi:hypothetical protein
VQGKDSGVAVGPLQVLHFNTCPHQILPGMTGPEPKLAIKPGAPRTCHTIPHRVPLHWKEQVEEGLKRDVKMGITEDMPANTPAKWCQSLIQTVNYLSLMGNNGIIQCPEKFKFGSKTVAWAGFTIGTLPSHFPITRKP